MAGNYLELFNGFLMRDDMSESVDFSGSLTLPENVEIYVDGKLITPDEENPIRLTGWTKEAKKSGKKYLSVAGSFKATSSGKGKPKPSQDIPDDDIPF